MPLTAEENAKLQKMMGDAPMPQAPTGGLTEEENAKLQKMMGDAPTPQAPTGGLTEEENKKLAALMEPSYEDIRFAQRYSTYQNIPPMADITPEWWEIATHVGPKDDQMGKDLLELVRRGVFDEGKNLNELSSVWRGLTEENKQSVADILGKSGVLEEMMVELGDMPDEDFNNSPVGQAIQMSAIARLDAPKPTLSQIEGELPPRYKYASLGKKGVFEGMAAEEAPLPFFPTIVSWRKNRELRKAIDTLNDAAANPENYEGIGGKGSEDDLLNAAYVVRKYTELAEYDQARGNTIARDVRNAIFSSISIGLEIGATAGLSSTVSAGGRALVTSVLKKAGIDITKTLARTAIRGAGALATAGVRTAAMPHRIADYYEKAKLQGVHTGWALAGGIADVFLMNIAEMSGVELAKLANKIPGGIPGLHRIVTKLEGGISKATSGKIGSKFAETLAQVGYHGPINEYAEERLETALTAAFNTRDFGMTPEESNILTRMMKVQPGLRDTVVELIAFAVPGAGIAAVKEMTTTGTKAQRGQWTEKQKEILDKKHALDDQIRKTNEAKPSIPRKTVTYEDGSTFVKESFPILENENAKEVIGQTLSQVREEDVSTPDEMEFVNKQNANVTKMQRYAEMINELKEVKRRREQGFRVVEREGEDNLEYVPDVDPTADIAKIDKNIAQLERGIQDLVRNTNYNGKRLDAARKRADKAKEITLREHRNAAFENAQETLDKANNIDGKGKRLRPEFQAVLDTITDRFRTTEITDQQYQKDLQTIDRYQNNPNTVSLRQFKAARNRIREYGKPNLKDMPAGQIKAIEAMVEDLIEQNLAKDAEITDMMKQRTQLIRDSIKTTADIFGRKYAPDYRGKSSFLRRAFRKTVDFIITQGMTYPTLMRYIAAPGTAAHEMLVRDAIKADLLDFPAIVSTNTDVVKAEMKRQGIDADIWETELVTMPLVENAKLENGQWIKELQMTRSEWAMLYALLDDPDRYEQLKKTGAEGVKLSPNVALAIKISQPNLLALKRLSNLPANERNAITKFATWMKDGQFDKVIADLYIQSQYDRRGWARPHREGYFPSTREAEFLEQSTEKWGEPTKGRTDSEAPFLVESILKTHARVLSAMARHATKSAIQSRFNDVIGEKEGAGDRDTLQAIRSNFRNGQQIINHIRSRQAQWAGKEVISKTEMDKLVRSLTRAGHIGALGFNIPVSFYQPVSMLTTLCNRGIRFAKHLFAVKSLSLRQLADMDKFVRENIPWLKERFQGQVTGIITPDTADLDVAMRYGAKGGILKRAINKFQKAAMTHIQVFDRLAINRIGQAIKLEGIEKGLWGQALDNYVIDELVNEVIATQPSSDATSLTGWHVWARKVPALRPFVMFTSPLVKQYNQIAQAAQDFRFKTKTGAVTAADFGELGYRVSVPLVINSLLIYAIKYGYDELVDAIFGVEKKKKKELADHIEGVVNRASGNLVVSGTYIYRALDKIKARAEGRQGYDIDSNIVTDSVGAICDSVGMAYRAYGERNPRKRADKLHKATSKFMRGAEIGGFPGGMIAPIFERMTNKSKYRKRR